jgi:peroxiredoxin
VLLAGCEGTVPGRRAPGFTLHDVAGRPVSLSEFRGKAVLLHFWGGWAPPCRLMLAELVKVQRARGSAPFTVLAIAVDETPEQAVKDLKAVAANFPALVADGEVTRRYFPGADLTVPLSLLLDARGVILDRFLGFRSAGDLDPAIERALAR